MARDPGSRFQTAKDFQLALEHWANNAGPALANALRAPAGRASVADGTGQFARHTPPSSTLGTGTPGVWAKTGGVAGEASAVPIKNGKVGLFAALGVVGLLLVAGAAFGVRLLTRAPAPPASASSDQQDQAKDKVATAALVASARTEQAALDAKAEAERNAHVEHPAAPPSDSAAPIAVAPGAVALPAPAPVPTRLVASKPRVVAKPKATSVRAAAPMVAPAAPKEQPKPAPAAASTGRKIRTSL